MKADPKRYRAFRDKRNARRRQLTADAKTLAAKTRDKRNARRRKQRAAAKTLATKKKK
jgi:hypothetical protein